MLQLLKAFELFKKKVIFVTLIVKAFVRLTIHELRRYVGPQVFFIRMVYFWFKPQYSYNLFLTLCIPSIDQKFNISGIASKI